MRGHLGEGADRMSGQNNNNVPPIPAATPAVPPPSLCACDADRCLKGLWGWSPHLQGLLWQAGMAMSVIKNEHASLHPVTRCHQPEWDTTAVCWL